MEDELTSQESVILIGAVMLMSVEIPAETKWPSLEEPSMFHAMLTIGLPRIQEYTRIYWNILTYARICRSILYMQEYACTGMY